MRFLRFMTSIKGRVARVLLGIGVSALGQILFAGTLSTVLTLGALVPISGGVLDFCLIGVPLGYPLSGTKTRQILERQGG